MPVRVIKGNKKDAQRALRRPWMSKLTKPSPPKSGRARGEGEEGVGEPWRSTHPGGGGELEEETPNILLSLPSASRWCPPYWPSPSGNPMERGSAAGSLHYGTAHRAAEGWLSRQSRKASRRR